LFSLAFLSLAFLWYNNGSETAVYMIFLAGGNGSLNVWYLKKASSSLGRLFSCANYLDMIVAIKMPNPIINDNAS
jgi:hypothetical protein